MLGFGKNDAAIDAFAIELVAELADRFPPESVAALGGTRLKPATKLAKSVNALERSVGAFSNERHLGVYGKAKLLNKIKWLLQEGGYPSDFVDATVGTLAQYLGARDRGMD